MRDSKPDLFDWLGIRKNIDYSANRWVGGMFGFLLSFIALAVTFAAVFALFRVISEVFTLNGDNLRELGYVLLGLLGAPFVVWRAIIAQKQANTAEQGLITDRINKAVEGLGTEKTTRRIKKKPNGERYSMEMTIPNIEVRIGAIYALERIAKKSEPDHIQIMEILCAYIRENAPAADGQKNPAGEWPDYPEIIENQALWDYNKAVGDYREQLEIWTWTLRHHHKPRADIQTALSVLGRRDPARIDGKEADAYLGADRYRLDLRATNLQAADLSHLDLRFAQLQGAEMQGAVLSAAKMQGAVLSGAKMQGAVLSEAKMQGAVLFEAEMQGAVLSGAKMQEARFFEAKMQGADLIQANLRSANWARLRIDSVLAQFADLRDAQGLTQDHLSALIGNAATLLPNDANLYVPDHWETEPPNWQVLVAADPYTDESEMRRMYLCAPGQTPQKTGTPWPADRDPPWVELGLSVHDWVAQQPTRGPVSAENP